MLENVEGVVFKPIYFSYEPPQPAPEYLSEYKEALTTQDIHEITGISEQTIRAELEAGKIPGNRIGRQWVVAKPAFIAFMYGRCS
jgi:excisionase family DNA binding protein